MYKKVKNIYDYGPQILIILSTILFIYLKKINVLVIYSIGCFINILLNIILKNTIKDTRLTKNGSDKYNMPSGHSQTVFYSLVFMILFLYNNKILLAKSIKIFIILLYTVIAFNVAYRCVIFKFHTVDQVVIGSIIGSIFPVLLYKYSKY
jgi:membrane-associated phospholipid phosphatase